MSPPLSATAALFILFVTTTSAATIFKTEQHTWGPFNTSYFNTFSILNGNINFGALQVTPESAGSVNLTNISGRIFNKQPFALWTDDSELFSFNTSFLVNVFRVNNATPGEGISFLIAPNLTIPDNSYGGFLGLTNSTTDGSSDNKIVAVELDTVKQAYDPDNNHIGLNINSVNSTVAVPLSKYGYEISPNGTAFYMIWIEYDGSRRGINVFMAPQADKDGPTVAKPLQPVLSSKLDLRNLVSQKSFFGFSASTGRTFELNCVLRWNVSIQTLPEKSSVIMGIITKRCRLGLVWAFL
ncbi:hypothetical protein PIB30_117811 [Stylosanthes scabra]|uniref:Legume lectin domain-containing protein n=1 Tax=Stylosanthes scabra TaxID=79078 RepID=A0ABU6RGT3_9FABA|nr:hypothetical protein [Stylosanthes scabra]